MTAVQTNSDCKMFVNAHFVRLTIVVFSFAIVVSVAEKVPGAVAVRQDFPAPGRVCPNNWGLGIRMVTNEPDRFVIIDLASWLAVGREPNSPCCRELPAFS